VHAIVHLQRSVSLFPQVSYPCRCHAFTLRFAIALAIALSGCVTHTDFQVLHHHDRSRAAGEGVGVSSMQLASWMLS
jgi:hypothetical protein